MSEPILLASTDCYFWFYAIFFIFLAILLLLYCLGMIYLPPEIIASLSYVIKILAFGLLLLHGTKLPLKMLIDKLISTP